MLFFQRFWSQRFVRFMTKKRVKEQLALPLLNSGRCAHRHRNNRHIAVRANKRDRKIDEVFDELRVIEINETCVLLIEGFDGLHVSVG